MALAILCVLAIFIAPDFDLPESGLRAQQAAETLLWVLATAAVFFVSGWSGLAQCCGFESLGEPPQWTHPLVFRELSCTLLC